MDQPDHNRRRAGLYVRVSQVGNRTPDTFHSPELQLRAMRDYAASHGLTEVATWTDLDRTGTDFDRAGIQEAFTAARAGDIDVLVLYDVSRFGRTSADSLTNIDALRDVGVAVVSTQESFDDSPAGQFQLGLYLGLAQLQSQQMGRRWAETHRYRLDRGLWHGVPPFGYVRTGAGQPISPDPVLAEHVSQAFRDYAAGVAVRTIARTLTAARGAYVPPVTVRRMLENPGYLGLVRYFETRHHGKRLKRVPGSERRGPGQHEALVDDDLWERVQARLREQATEPTKRRAEPVDPVTGLVVCSRCEARMVVHLDSRNGRRRLECPKQIGRACAGVGSPYTSTVLEVVLSWLAVEPGDDAAVAEADTTDRDRERASRKRRDLAQAHADQLDVKLATLTDKVLDGTVTDAAYKVTASKLEADRDRELRTVARHDALHQAPVPGDPVGAILAGAERLLTADELAADPGTGKFFGPVHGGASDRLRRVGAAIRSGRFAALEVPEQNRLLRAALSRVVLWPNPRHGAKGTMPERLDLLDAYGEPVYSASWVEHTA